MSAEQTLLPANATAFERAVDLAGDARLAALPSVVASIWNADTCPVVLLPYLAWALSVDEWSNDWSVERKRAAIKDSRTIHKHKGTIWAIKRALAAIGHPDATIVERGDYIKRNGTALRDASHQRMGQGGWATFRVALNNPVTIDQAQQIQRLLAAVKRNCITLTAVDYRQASVRRNGAIVRDGAYSRGVVDTSI